HEVLQNLAAAGGANAFSAQNVLDRDWHACERPKLVASFSLSVNRASLTQSGRFIYVQKGPDFFIALLDGFQEFTGHGLGGHFPPSQELRQFRSGALDHFWKRVSGE